MGLIEALHAEIADTEAALAQLQQETLGHADLLASYPDQVIHLASLLMTVSAGYGTQALPQGHCAMFCLSQASNQDMHSSPCFKEVSPVLAVLMCMPEHHLSVCFVCSDDSAAETAR